MQENRAGVDAATIRVLLADTGALLREQLADMLSQAKCQVLTATDGFEVLCRLPELRPDVLLIASDLPRLSGIQVCSLLRQSPDFAMLPVVVLAGQNAMVDKVRAKMVGATTCLEKPFSSAELHAALRVVFKADPLKEDTDVGVRVHC